MSNGVWQTFVKMTTNAASTVLLPSGSFEFRVVGADPANVFGGNAVETVPCAGLRLDRRDDAAAAWTRFPVDGQTGALAFRLTESLSDSATLACDIVHAECQDFNLWANATGVEGQFIRSYFEGCGSSLGGSPDTREYVGALAAWSSPASANAVYWTECFRLYCKL